MPPQGKEHCILAQDDLQHKATHREVCNLPGVWKISATHRHYPGTAPFPWHTLATDLFHWKRMDFLIVVDVFLKYIIVRKLPNSTSEAVCIELSMIVTELGLPHIIRSDNDPCYNFKEFQQFLQHYSITHQTSSPNHPRSNGFVERMVRVAKKLMDKAEKEGKPWISGLFDYRVTPVR